MHDYRCDVLVHDLVDDIFDGLYDSRCTKYLDEKIDKDKSSEQVEFDIMEVIN